MKTKQWCCNIEGTKTDFILCSYSNRLFFVITQLEKLGTLMEASSDLSAEGETTYSVRTLLGKREPTSEVYARELISLTYPLAPKPLLLALSLKATSPTIFKTIIAQIKQNIQIQ
uniref:Uncharacterized protein n=1 Tax=Arcella intermedia TaxID=1963864 RepID=A0A6B2LSG0_9EUKA